MVHLAWGPPEVDWSAASHEREHDLRTAIATLYRALRGGRELDPTLRELWSPAAAGRALRVLLELRLAQLDGRRATVDAKSGA